MLISFYIDFNPKWKLGFWIFHSNPDVGISYSWNLVLFRYFELLIFVGIEGHGKFVCRFEHLANSLLQGDSTSIHLFISEIKRY